MMTAADPDASSGPCDRVFASRISRACAALLVAGGLSGCDPRKPSPQATATAADATTSPGIPDKAMNPPLRTPEAVGARAEEIRRIIERSRRWGTGGHSPIPTRALDSNSYVEIRKETTAGDAPALRLLLLDEAADIRWAAASLLECLNPNADREISEAIANEPDLIRRDRLQQAVIAIRVIRAGGTSCK